MSSLSLDNEFSWLAHYGCADGQLVHGGGLVTRMIVGLIERSWAAYSLP
jgi:hypothetical protein